MQPAIADVHSSQVWPTQNKVSGVTLLGEGYNGIRWGEDDEALQCLLSSVDRTCHSLKTLGCSLPRELDAYGPTKILW